MFTLLLGVALATQTTPSAEQIDLYFTASQEEFTYEVSPNKKTPRYIEELFVELGCTEWTVRDEASKKLYRLCRGNPKDERWLFWGRHNKDLEIAYRCDRIISRLHVCDNCSGSGVSKYNQNYDCWQCKNLGTIWGLNPWNNNRQ